VKMNNGFLFEYMSETGLRNHGFIWGRDIYDVCILHIHGSYGNFYQNSFLASLCERFLNYKTNLCTINLTSHDGLAEGFFSEEKMEYVGGGVSEYGTCVDDIKGAIAELKKTFKRIILQGHSLGCDRVLSFCLNSDYNERVILLGPCDSAKLHSIWTLGESVVSQLERIDQNSDSGLSWINESEYGVRCGQDWTYNLPIKKNAFESIVLGDPFKLFNITNPMQFYLDIDFFVYLGDSDPLRTFSINDFDIHMSTRCKSCYIYVGAGGHMLEGCEEDVSSEIFKWL